MQRSLCGTHRMPKVRVLGDIVGPITLPNRRPIMEQLRKPPRYTREHDRLKLLTVPSLPMAYVCLRTTTCRYISSECNFLGGSALSSCRRSFPILVGIIGLTKSVSCYAREEDSQWFPTCLARSHTGSRNF